ncbi:hypothetical protein FIU87_05535 [Bacillus sp. THAF10]|uniref:hypothetical protein n=1 Tax=Bacillus sp. THAF10 TaxID=2587848 RepID=UPI00126929D6|nr:hypothetical protein [Bacillus sp. THAF10]QFT88094.1 hypothetical protein FIU87_05535 [Bacillus sp. THAF10]
MIKVILDIDRQELKKLIKLMDLYPNTKKAIAEYKLIEKKLIDRESILLKQLAELKGVFTQNLLDQEVAEVSDLIYLKKQAKKCTGEMEIIDVLLAETRTEIEELKYDYYKIYQKALSTDGAIPSKYDVTTLIDSTLNQVLAIIGEVGKEVHEQYHEIFPEVNEIFSDNKVRQRFPRIHDESFRLHHHQPQYRGSKVILENQDINSAAIGFIPTRFKVNGGVENE